MWAVALRCSMFTSVSLVRRALGQRNKPTFSTAITFSRRVEFIQYEGWHIGRHRAPAASSCCGGCCSRRRRRWRNVHWAAPKATAGAVAIAIGNVGAMPALCCGASCNHRRRRSGGCGASCSRSECSWIVAIAIDNGGAIPTFCCGASCNLRRRRWRGCGAGEPIRQ